jgi:hypothetical protein
MELAFDNLDTGGDFCMIGCSRCDSQRSTVGVFVTWVVGVYRRTKELRCVAPQGPGVFFSMTLRTHLVPSQYSRLPVMMSSFSSSMKAE